MIKMVACMKKMAVLFLLSFVVLFACKNATDIENSSSPEDWTIFRGNPSLSGYTSVSLPDNPVLLWTFASGNQTQSSPVIYGDVAYWSDRRGRVFGVNMEGEQVFSFAMETAVNGTPMIYDSVLYIGRIDGFLYAISLATQDTLWTFETFGQISASPNRVSLGEKSAIVVGSYDSYLYVLDARDGIKINSFESGYYLNGAVAQSGNHIVYGGCDALIRVVDFVAGVQTDSMEVDSYIPASPAVSGNHVYIADHSGMVYELRLNKGRIASSKKIMAPEDEESRGFVSVPAVSDDRVYIISDDRHLYAIRRNNGTIAWKSLLKGDTGESSPVVSNNKVLACTRTGIITIHDANTGTPLWEYDTGEQILASPAVINGRFFILTARGTLFCFGTK